MYDKKEYSKQYYEENKEQLKEKREKNKDKINEYQKQYRKDNKDKFKEYSKQYREDNKELKKEYRKQYYEENKDRMIKYSKQYWKNRMKTDPLFKLKERIKSRNTIAIKKQRTKKAYRTMESLGCTIEQVRNHLEKQFTSNMNWSNHGTYWHIDHIIPISYFDLEDKTEQKIAFHYGNMQPLTVSDNLTKHNTVPNANFVY